MNDNEEKKSHAEIIAEVGQEVTEKTPDGLYPLRRRFLEHLAPEFVDPNPDPNRKHFIEDWSCGTPIRSDAPPPIVKRFTEDGDPYTEDDDPYVEESSR